MNSIRISDHKGKEHLSYRYNIQPGVKIPKWYKDDKGYWRYSCSTSKRDVNKLIDMIIENKFFKVVGYKGNYNKVMEEYKQKALIEKGFWEQARKIQEWTIQNCDATLDDIDYYD